MHPVLAQRKRSGLGAGLVDHWLERDRRLRGMMREARASQLWLGASRWRRRGQRAAEQSVSG